MPFWSKRYKQSLGEAFGNVPKGETQLVIPPHSASCPIADTEVRDVAAFFQPCKLDTSIWEFEFQSKTMSACAYLWIYSVGSLVGGFSVIYNQYKL